MINVDLLSNNGTVLATSSRPAILRYQSMTQRVLHVLAKAIPLLIGWTEESQYIHVVLIENYIEKKVSSFNNHMKKKRAPQINNFFGLID